MAKAWGASSDIKVLASGTIVLQGDGGLWAPWTCPWMVEVPSFDPEPSCKADTVKIVDCGAKVKDHSVHPGRGWECEVGHHHLDIEIAWTDEAELAGEAEAERRAEMWADYDPGRDVW